MMVNGVEFWRFYGYDTEAEYYRDVWGGISCPACKDAKTLDTAGRKHADGSACDGGWWM